METIRGSITNSQNIKDFPRYESLWDIMVPYVSLHSPVGSLLLVFQCLKKVSNPEGFWLESAKIFGDANFFSDRRELIEKSEEYLFTGDHGDYFISEPMSSEEINKYIIQDLLIDYIETHPFIGELRNVSGEETRVFINPFVPEIVKIWPMMSKEGWRFVCHQPPVTKKGWSDLDNIIDFIQTIAFQTWLGSPVTSKPLEDFVTSPILVESKEAIIDLKVLAHGLTSQFSALRKFFKNDSAYFSQQIGFIVSNLISGNNYSQSKNWYRFIRTEYPEAGMLVTAFALESDKGRMIRKWIEHYRERYSDQKNFLLKNISVKSYTPSLISSVYPTKTKKKILRFVPDTKDNQNNKRPRRKFSFGGW